MNLTNVCQFLWNAVKDIKQRDITYVLLAAFPLHIKHHDNITKAIIFFTLLYTHTETKQMRRGAGSPRAPEPPGDPGLGPMVHRGGRQRFGPPHHFHFNQLSALRWTQSSPVVI